MAACVVNVEIGDCFALLQKMASASVDCCVTSPPYFALRNYQHQHQVGFEPTPEAYVENLVRIFREVKRVLKKSGTFWLNLGDTYNAYNGNRGASKSLSKKVNGVAPSWQTGSGLTVKNLTNKQLIGIPWRVALALQADGWILRQDIIWQKTNPKPESVTDRCAWRMNTSFYFPNTSGTFLTRRQLRSQQRAGMALTG